MTYGTHRMEARRTGLSGASEGGVGMLDCEKVRHKHWCRQEGARSPLGGRPTKLWRH